MSTLPTNGAHLPATVTDLVALRRGRRQRTLIDQVEDIHLSLWENEEYRSYFDALNNAHSVEGKIDFDRAKAADMVRNYAREHNIVSVGDEKLAPLVTTLNFVLRRYGLSQKQRRNAMLAAE